MKYQGIIFDLDGVLCFTDRYHFLAWKALADRLGIYFDEQINHRQRGISRMESLEVLLEQSPMSYSAEEKLQLAEEKNETYKKLLEQMSPADVTEEVRQTLTALRARGMRLAIGSSSKNTPLILQKTRSAEYFDAVSDGNNITRSKPDPEVFVKAAAMLGLQPSQCLVVEDAIAGIEAGVAGGIETAAIGEATRSEKPTYKLQTFADLLTL